MLKKMTVEDVKRGGSLLAEYRLAKAPLTARLNDDAAFWASRHTDAPAAKKGAILPKSTSTWLFNAIAAKHADAMDSMPVPMVLPVEENDTKVAEDLGIILPALLEKCGFEDTYSANWWEKLIAGTAVYGVFWDPERAGGLGDIAVTACDLDRLFWDPTCVDIQDSANVFYVGDGEDGDAVVDWYYKVKNPAGKRVLHYARFKGEELLFASENLERYAEGGYYHHGLYPFFFDVLYPEKGAPVGYGYISLFKNCQIYIDELSQNILDASLNNSKKRYFVSEGSAVNEKEFLDREKPLVHVAGEIGDERIKEMVPHELDKVYTTVLQMKIDELKENSANRDVTTGGTYSGVNSAAAIVALQESGSKLSRDMIGASYRVYARIIKTVVELLRQFYTVPRTFRIVGSAGVSFASWSNIDLYADERGVPDVDIKMTAQKQSPLTQERKNEQALQFFDRGFFAPEKREEAKMALAMMSFDGKEAVLHALEAAT